MTAGLEIINDSLTVQITQDFGNFVFAQKFVFSSISGGNFSFSYTGRTPLLAFSGPGYCCIQGLSIVGNTYTYIIRCLNTATSATVYVFDSLDPAVASTSNSGLQVFKPNGQIGFDSSFKYLKIDSIIPVSGPLPVGGAPNSTKTYGLPTGKTYAVFIGYQRMGIYSIPFTEQLYLADAVGVNNSLVTIGALTIGNYGSYSGSTGGLNYSELNNPPSIVVLDVTGL